VHGFGTECFSLALGVPHELGVRLLVALALARHRVSNMSQALKRDVRTVVGDCLRERPIRHPVRVVTGIPFLAVVALE
jgi:hypothetical protein